MKLKAPARRRPELSGVVRRRSLPLVTLQIERRAHLPRDRFAFRSWSGRAFGAAVTASARPSFAT